MIGDMAHKYRNRNKGVYNGESNSGNRRVTCKSEDYKKFLGSNYEVDASGGHVRDLPKSQLGLIRNTTMNQNILRSEEREMCLQSFAKK